MWVVRMFINHYLYGGFRKGLNMLYKILGLRG